jgi:hypothetical protein
VRGRRPPLRSVPSDYPPSDKEFPIASPHRPPRARLAALGVTATAAFADGSQTITPTAKQKAAIIKAWAGSGTAPAAKCVTVKLSKNTPVWAGLAFNTKATGCGAAAFDGTAILWGKGTRWNLLMEGSDVDATTCTAMASVLGVNAWVDLAGYAGGMGCENTPELVRFGGGPPRLAPGARCRLGSSIAGGSHAPHRPDPRRPDRPRPRRRHGVGRRAADGRADGEAEGRDHQDVVAGHRHRTGQVLQRASRQARALPGALGRLVVQREASGCSAVAFDSASILYGVGRHFYLLTAASAMDPDECTATALVMGPQAWANLVDAGVGLLGCENID